MVEAAYRSSQETEAVQAWVRRTREEVEAYNLAEVVDPTSRRDQMEDGRLEDLDQVVRHWRR